ncbi:MAG: ArnT family glycosyltransferase [Kiritimatiellia bacterium]
MNNREMALPAAEEKTRPRKEALWGALFCGLLMIPSLFWLQLDHGVWDWDPAEYGYFAIDLWRTLWTSPRLWPWMFFYAVGPKAPTLIWIGHFLLPLRHLLGGPENVFNLVILAFQWGSLFLLWLTIRNLTKRNWIACLLCLWLAGMPLFVGHNHVFMTEPLQLFAVSLLWYATLCGEQWSAASMLACLLWGGAFVLGSKASTPVYCVIPAVYGVYLLFRRIRRRCWGLNWWNGIGILTGFAHLSVIAAWYVLNLAQMKQKVMDASFGEAAYVFGYRDTFFNKLFYWIRATAESATLKTLSMLLVLCALIMAVGWVRHYSRRAGGRDSQCVLALAGMQIVVVYVVLSINISTPIRYVYAALPSFLLLAAVCIVRIDGFWTRRALMVCMATWFLGCFVLYLGILPAEEVENARYWHSPRLDRSRMSQIDYLVHLLNRPEYDEVYHLCGADFHWLSGSTLNYYAAVNSLETGCRTRFGRLGHSVADTEEAWAKVHDQLGCYIAASPEHMNAREDAYGRVAREVLSRIRMDPRFSREYHEELTDIEIYRNIALKKPERQTND